MNIEDISIHESKNSTEDAHEIKKNLDKIVSQVRTVMDCTYNFNPTFTATVMIDTLLTVLDETGIMPRELFFCRILQVINRKVQR